MTLIQSPVDDYRIERGYEAAAVSGLREIYRYTGKNNLNSVAMSSAGTICVVGDGGAIGYGSFGRAPANQTAGSSFANGFTEVCTNNAGAWVAVGENSQIQSSTNGTTWNSQRSGSGWLNSVAYGNGYYVVAGSGGVLLTCPNANGTPWTLRNHALTGADLAAVIYVPELMIWICATTDGRIQTCGADPTGTWTARYTVPGTSPAFQWRGLAYNAAFGGIVGLYRRNTTEAGFAVSADGVNWSTTGSVAGWQSIGVLRFTMMDRSLVVWDYYSSTNDLLSYVMKTPDMTGQRKFMGTLGKLAIMQCKNYGGQLYAVGQIETSTGILLTSRAFRPNSFAEI